MIARVCACQPSQVFETSETCNTCGHNARTQGAAASTRRLATALAEIALGHRRAGDQRHDHI